VDTMEGGIREGERDPTMCDSGPDVERDLDLVRRIAGGCLASWHAFVDRFSGLILTVARRYLARESDDEHRTVYVETLKALRAGKLDQYDGRTGLATWVAVVTRGCSLDHLRHRHGRRDPPRWLRTLPERDRKVYRLYYLEGWSLRRIRQQLGGDGTTLGMGELADSLDRIEGCLDRRTRRRLAYDLQAQQIGGTSGRMLEYLDHLSAEIEERARALSPEQELERRELAGQVERLRGLLQRLPALERKVIRMHFMEHLTAREIAGELELRNQRRAYTLIDRGLRQLGTMLDREAAAENVACHLEQRDEPGTAR
jgi:DNA-directed RNA polymerase specialized sigma24 family protein